MTDAAVVRRLLVEILTGRGPVQGARVGIELRRAFELRTGTPFDLRKLGFSRFFNLLAAHSDVVEVERPVAEGDLLVRLRRCPGVVAEPTAPPGLRTPTDGDSRPPRLRAPVWQAFTNPDPDRVRVIHRTTGDVAHFHEPPRDATESHAIARVAAWGANAMRVSPIDGATQLGWMAAFLADAPFDEARRGALSRLTQGTYSSSLNAIFTDALGEESARWRGVRARHVFGVVSAWARQQGIDMSVLAEGVTAPAGISADGDSPAVAPTPLQIRVDAGELRRAMGELTDDELGTVLVPLSVVARLMERRGSR